MVEDVLLGQSVEEVLGLLVRGNELFPPFRVRQVNHPGGVLNLDMRQEVQNQQRIIATYKKGKSESHYETLVYKAKKICWERISFPDSYSYIPIPQD